MAWWAQLKTSKEAVYSTSLSWKNHCQVHFHYDWESFVYLCLYINPHSLFKQISVMSFLLICKTHPNYLCSTLALASVCEIWLHKSNLLLTVKKPLISVQTVSILCACFSVSADVIHLGYTCISIVGRLVTDGAAALPIASLQEKAANWFKLWVCVCNTWPKCAHTVTKYVH